MIPADSQVDHPVSTENLGFEPGLHPRGYFVRMRGGLDELWFLSLLEAADFVKSLPENRCPVLYVPGIERWLAFVLLGEGFARYGRMDKPFEQALVRAAKA